MTPPCTASADGKPCGRRHAKLDGSRLYSHIAIPPGTRLGAYDILAKIGEGGMGEVYRAKDSKLKREVALKVLPAEVAGDRERLARFQREAEVLASLNHPNIAHIFGLEESTDTIALVMELVEGEDLSQRIARGPIPLDEALPIAKQIAEALEAAHEQGIIHRDLKPANIKVRPDGTVKVLDFGLAKALDGAGHTGWPGQAAGALANSPTITSPAMTMRGVILGTAAYMSPEQARGKPVDKRADIWALGCVLYEMITATRAFDGDTMTDVLGAVVRAEPDWTRLPAETPDHVRRLLTRCLRKDTATRLRDIGEARIALADPGNPVGGPVDRRAARPHLSRAGLAAGGLSLVVMAAGMGWYAGSAGSAAPAIDVTPYAAEIVPIPPDAFDRRSTSNLFTFTPNGDALIYAATDPAARLLYRRGRESHVAVPIAGTEGAYGPFVSPDGTSLGFFADGAMKRVPMGGGAAQVIHNMRAPGAPDRLGFGWTTELGPGRELGLGAAWLPDGTIVYGRFFGGLWRTTASGGSPIPVTSVGDGEIAHRLPRLLPGGRAILCTVIRDLIATENSSVEAVDLATGERTRLVDDATDGRYVANGSLVFARRGAIYSVGFDAAALKVSGEPVQVSGDVMHAIGGGNPGRSSGAAQYDVSADGMLAVIGGGTNTQVSRLVVWIERGGKVVPVSSEPAGNLGPRLSPDGTRIALRRAPDIVIMNALDGIATPLFKGALFPVWSHDGARVMVANRGSNSQEIHGVPLSGGAPEVIVSAANPLWPSSVSTDGSFMAYVESSPVTGNDIWVVGLSPKAAPVAVVATEASEGYPMFSPDGKWLAYSVEEGDSNGVYVRPFPGPGRAERIAGSGSTAPIWTRDGRAILYGRLSEAGAFIEEIVRVSIDTAGDRLRLGPPETFARGEFNRSTPVSNFDITASGTRILTTVDAPPAAGALRPASAGRILQLTFPPGLTRRNRR